MLTNLVNRVMLNLTRSVNMLGKVSTIYQTFENLQPEKRLRIITAAMREFAAHGFKNASTDVIVQAAGISKGALYHYFGNKKNLYLYLFDHGIDVLANKLLCRIDLNEQDMFRRLRQIAQVKLELFQQYPNVIDFVMTANMEEDARVKADLQSRIKDLSDLRVHEALSNFDTSAFRDGIDPAKVLEIVTWTINGLVERAIRLVRSHPGRSINYQELFAEVDAYLEMLKQGFYK
ncbi:MAG TPA: TetR/AcrR family transcriptional regulator [Firmicutes bacterium]|jgi:TetR/AcrR family transcriptional regulator|nr:TetR/AcrR family transcriptional regulator [Bacillota bacterium]